MPRLNDLCHDFLSMSDDQQRAKVAQVREDRHTYKDRTSTMEKSARKADTIRQRFLALSPKDKEAFLASTRSKQELAPHE